MHRAEDTKLDRVPILLEESLESGTISSLSFEITMSKPIRAVRCHRYAGLDDEGRAVPTPAPPHAPSVRRRWQRSFRKPSASMGGKTHIALRNHGPERLPLCHARYAPTAV